MKITKKLISVVFAILLALCLTSAALAEELISRPGEYRGYSEQIYDGVELISQYVEVTDGTKQALDIYRPTQGGELVTDPLPVVLSNTRYNRCPPQEIIDLENFVKYGYVVAVLDARGTGASYGYRYGPFSQQENEDAKDIIEWFAVQDWCDGKVAMWGSSYMGQSQYGIPSVDPPHLVAMTPAIGGIDWYSFIYPNGVMNTGFLIGWSQSARFLDTEAPFCPVPGDDGDPQSEHWDNLWPTDIFYPDMSRNSYDEFLGVMPNIDRSAISRSKEIKKSGVAMYHIGAWFDGFSAEQLAAYKLWGEKIVLAPWAHGDYYYGEGLIFIQKELLRWYDYILKGIDNGIVDEPPICYATIDNQKPGTQWRFASQWPLPNQKLTKFYFNSKESGTVASVNDGSLTTRKPKKKSAADDYAVNYECSVFGGTYNRMHRGQFGDMTENPDELGLTYTSPALDSDLEMTGHPVAHLWVSSDRPDGYFLVYLEEVDGNGVSNYVSDGVIRASHRKLHPKKPWNAMKVPYHRSYEKDIESLPENGEPVELVFDLFPMSYIFHAGNRIRVTITGSNQAAYIFPESLDFNPPPNVKIYREKKHASYITLPIIPK